MGKTISTPQTQVLKSYRGVFINIEDSDICSLKYGVYFYFCSEAMKVKFDNNVEEYIKKTISRLEYVIPDLGLNNLELALAIQYYVRYVEKRGFRIETLHGVRIGRGHIVGDVEFIENKEE